jgi:hypothetical protein
MQKTTTFLRCRAPAHLLPFILLHIFTRKSAQSSCHRNIFTKNAFCVKNFNEKYYLLFSRKCEDEEVFVLALVGNNHNVCQVQSRKPCVRLPDPHLVSCSLRLHGEYRKIQRETDM